MGGGLNHSHWCIITSGSVRADLLVTEGWSYYSTNIETGEAPLATAYRNDEVRPDLGGKWRICHTPCYNPCME